MKSTTSWFRLIRLQEIMILSSSMYEKHTYRVILKEFLKIFKSQVSSRIHLVLGLLDLLFTKIVRSHKPCMGTLSCGHSPPIYIHLICEFFIKILIIISISTNIYRSSVCDPLGPDISLVNNFIDQITPYWSTFINYPHQHID